MLSKLQALIGTAIIGVILLSILLFGVLTPIEDALNNWFSAGVLICLMVILWGIYSSGDTVNVRYGYKGILSINGVMSSDYIADEGNWWIMPFCKMEVVSVKDIIKNMRLVKYASGDHIEVSIGVCYTLSIEDVYYFKNEGEYATCSSIEKQIDSIISRILSDYNAPLYAVPIPYDTRSQVNSVANNLSEIEKKLYRYLGGQLNTGYSDENVIYYPKYGVSLKNLTLSGGIIENQRIIADISMIVRKKLQYQIQAIQTETVVNTINRLIASGVRPEFSAQIALVLAGKADIDDVNWVGVMGGASSLNTLFLNQ